MASPSRNNHNLLDESEAPLQSSSNNSSSDEVNSNPFTSPTNVVPSARQPSGSSSNFRPDSRGSQMTGNPFAGGIPASAQSTISSRPALHSSGPSGFASSSMQHLPLGSKGSMVLYRVATESDSVQPGSNRNSGNSNFSDTNALIPPSRKIGGSGTNSNRSSIISFGFGEDVNDKYPSFPGNSSTQQLNHVPSSISNNSTGSTGTSSPFGGLSLTTAALIAQAETQGPFASFPSTQHVLASPSPAHSPSIAPRPALLSAPSTPTSGTSPMPLNAPRGLIPYSYDPAVDSLLPDDEEDILHDPNATPEAEKRLYAKGGLLHHNGRGGDGGSKFGMRGYSNLGLLITVMVALIMLFVGYPVIVEFRDRGRLSLIDGNIRVNATGQAPVLFGVRELVDSDTPDHAKTRTGFDGETYDLVFSDEFTQEGRTFWPGDDPFFEAMDIWYGVTQDLEWYDPQQVTTRDGALVLTMDSTTTTQPGLSPGSTAPFTTDQNHNLTYRSGMVQSWNKLCFTSGYIEVAVMLPGPNQNAQGYWPGAWTMGNLGRPGYRATTDGMWPYSYDSCDVGTFPNQTDHGGLTPAAAAFSDKSWPEYDKKLSVLTGQRLSSCTCPSSDHPGPYGNLDGTTRYRGRGAPEIDIIEIQRQGQTDANGELIDGNVASQSAQFAPFTHDYVFTTSSLDDYQIFNTSTTIPNTYTGSPLQQAVSALSNVPADGFAPNGRYVTYGFEYWADPKNRNDGFITWQVDGKKTVRMGPGAMGPDKGAGGSQVDQRIVPEEPMAMILNFGISHNWQTISLPTLSFPAEMKFDYVRIYQRRGHTNIGCNPPDYPTTDYINNHMDQYANPNKTLWEYEKPKNRLYDGC